MKKVLMILAISFVILNSSFVIVEAQLQSQAKIDSLLKELPKMKQDTNHVNLLADLSYEYHLFNPDDGIKYGEQALKIAENIKWKFGEAKSYSTLATNYAIGKSDYKKALEYYYLSLKISQELGNNEGIAVTLGNIALVYQRQYELDKALENYYESLSLNRMMGNKTRIAITLGGIATVYLIQSNYPEALKIFSEALSLNYELNNKSGIAITLGNLGVIYGSLSDYPKALEYSNKAYEINKELGRKINMSNNLGNIASVYSTLSNYPKALEYYLKSLKISEEISAEDNIAINLGNIGILHHNQSEYTKALDYLYRALEINERLGRKLNMANNLGSIGQIYHDQSKYEKSLDYLQRSLTINEEIGNLEGVTNHLVTMGLIFLKNKKYEKSLENFNGALKIFKEVGYSYGIGSIYGHISNWYLSQLADSTLEKNEDYTNNAIEYGQKGLEILQELGELKKRSNILKTLSDVYTINSDFKKAYDAYVEYKKLADSIFTIDSKKAIANLETKRELDIKQKENENLLQKSELQHLDLIRKSQDMNLLNKEKELQHLAFLKEQAEKQEKEKQLSLSETQMKLQQSQIESLDKDKEKQNAELKAKNLQRNFLIAGAIVFIILFLIAFIRFREKKKLSERLTKQKQEIEKQKQIVENQKSIVEEKNEQIYASITYASTLPWDSTLQKAFGDILIFYKPKDIVSGDSYWFKEVEGIKYLAAIDCTGHGIPGAMLTVIASNSRRNGGGFNSY